MKNLVFLLYSMTISCTILGQEHYDSILFKKGQQLFENNNFEAAVKIYTQVIQKCPEFTAAYLNRGICNYNLQNLESAISDFDSTILVAKFRYKLATYIANVFFDLENYELSQNISKKHPN